MYGMAMTDRPQPFGGAIVVKTVDDLTYLIKESEVLSGEPGREFVAVHDGIEVTCLVRFDGFAYLVIGRTAGGTSANCRLSADELRNSRLGRAMTAGQLFCRPLEDERCSRSTAGDESSAKPGAVAEKPAEAQRRRF